MKHFSLNLKKILLCNSLYYILLLLSILYIFIYSKTYVPHKPNIKDRDILIIKNANIDGNKLTLEFNNYKGTYYFNKEEDIDNFKLHYSLGDTIELKATLKEPTNNTIPNIFNYKDYTIHKKIYGIFTIESFKQIKKNKNIPLKIKNFILKRIESIPNNSYLYAFILGKSSYIDNTSYNNYKINGITHLFALSGLHVSLFSSIILSILNKLKFKEKSSFIITSIFLISFSFIASFTPSILRATIFFILSNLNKIYYTFITPKNILLLVFTILIFINPFYIFDTGFILSFTITYFILLLNENITIKDNIKSILVVSILSFISSLPIIINLSFEVNIIGFINNIFFIPLVTNIIFPLSLIVIFIPKLSFILLFLTNFMELVSKYSSEILNITLYFQHISSLEIIIYYIILIISIKRNKKLFIVLILLIVFIYIKPSFNKDTNIYYIDVSQGDSSLIVSKNNKSILIDTGGKLSYKTEPWKQKNKDFNLMTSSMIPFFKSIGLKQIDYLILTHGDADHMGESVSLVNNFKVKNVILNCRNYNYLEKKLIKTLNQKNIKYYTCIDKLNVDDMNLQFLNAGSYTDENNSSSVIYFKYNNLKFLFMGDAGVNREKDILEKYKLTNIDFLKVGHHGSNTSSSEEFISTINPKYSIISVGKNNKYGHPKQSVIDILKNSKIYRTDQNGSIMLKIKNNKLKIETCSP